MKKNKYTIILTTILIILICIIIMLFINITNKQTFHKPQFETNAINEIPKELNYEESIVEISEGYSLYIDGIPTIKNNELILNLISLKENSVWIKIRVLNEKEQIIAESGLLKPGEYLKSIKLNRKASKKDNITYMIIGYEIDSYLSAGTISLNTRIGD